MATAGEELESEKMTTTSELGVDKVAYRLPELVLFPTARDRFYSTDLGRRRLRCHRRRWFQIQERRMFDGG
jgi:hypothetical protein